MVTQEILTTIFGNAPRGAHKVNLRYLKDGIKVIKDVCTNEKIIAAALEADDVIVVNHAGKKQRINRQRILEEHSLT